MQVFFILFSVYFAVYQYINSKCLYRTHVKLYLMIFGTRNPEKSLCHIFGTILSHLPNVPKIGQSGVADKCVKMYSFLILLRLFTARYKNE